MMMIQRQHQHQHQHPTVEIPPWDPPYDDPTSQMFSPQTNDYFSALHRYLPSSQEYDGGEDEFIDDDSVEDGLFDSFSCDSFRMYEFKVRKCVRGRSHDWTECPYAHPGEKARRRDPRKYHYSGTACPDFRRGCCRKGDACEFAHGVFECWLHPARYRTQPCKDGPHCKRRVCFFAHSVDQLRVLPHSESSRLGGQLGGGCDKGFLGMGVSPVSVLECPESPPMSPSYGDSVSELVNSMRGLQMSRSPRGGGGGWGMGGVGRGGGSVFGSPRSPMGGGGYCGGGSVPSTPTRTPTRSGLGLFDPWEVCLDEEVPMERVESGKDLRARIYAKLSKENSLDRDRVDSVSSGPDFGWISDLVQ